MMEVAGPQEVHSVHSRSTRRTDTSGSHSRSISDPIRSSWFLPSLDTCHEKIDLFAVQKFDNSIHLL